MPSEKFKWLTLPGSHDRPIHDVVVMESSEFAVLPSLGAISPDWFVLVPKRAISTLSEMSDTERQDLSNLRKRLRSAIEKRSGGCVFEFEHGGRPGSLVSCGVDQAHLHMVGLSFNLIDIALRHEMEWRASSDLSDLNYESVRGSEYLFMQCDKVSFVCNPTQPTSQWFRKIIAGVVGSEQWDYKRSPLYERVYSMARRYSYAV